MNLWLTAATVLLAGLLPCGFVLLRGRPLEALVALQLGGTVVTVVLLLLAEPLLFGPALALVIVGLGLAFTPGLAGRASQWAQRLEDRPARAAEVLRGVEPREAAAPSFHPGTAPYVYGAISTVGAVGFAAFGLYRRRLPGLVRREAGRVIGPPAEILKALHSGVVGDYVAWLTFGIAALGGLLALTVR